MARRELLKNPQFKEIISEMRANKEDIDREMRPDSVQMTEVRLTRDRLDRQIVEEGRPVIVFEKPATLRKAA